MLEISKLITKLALGSPRPGLTNVNRARSHRGLARWAVALVTAPGSTGAPHELQLLAFAAAHACTVESTHKPLYKNLEQFTNF